MATFHATFNEQRNLNATFSSSDGMSAAFGEVIIAGGTNVKVATTAEWNAQPGLIAENGIVYVYSDWGTIDGEPVPAFKVGDGLAYLIDMPFNEDIASRHIADNTIHVTAAEKEFWNNKVTAFLDAENLENLVLSKE